LKNGSGAAFTLLEHRRFALKACTLAAGGFSYRLNLKTHFPSKQSCPGAAVRVRGLAVNGLNQVTLEHYMAPMALGGGLNNRKISLKNIK